MTITYRATECAYEVEDGWLDHTRYLYESGELRTLIEPYCSAADGPAEVDAAIARFKYMVPGYEVVERRASEQPTPGSQIVTHRLGGLLARFEISVFFPLGGATWVFRVSGPYSAEDECRAGVESFLESYKPIEVE